MGNSVVLFQLSVVPGPVAHVDVIMNHESATVGTSYPTTQMVSEDQYFNPVPNATVQFTTPSTGATARESLCSCTSWSELTDGDGEASFSLNAGTVSGDFALLWQSSSGAQVTASGSVTLHNLPGLPALMLDSLHHTTPIAKVGTIFATSWRLRVLDGFGNALPGETVLFTCPSSGPSANFFDTSSPSSSATTNSLGVATAPTMVANGVPGNYTCSAQDESSTDVNDSVSFVNTAGDPATTVPAVAQFSPIPIGSEIKLGAYVYDSFGNPVPFQAVTWSCPVTGPSCTFFHGTATETGPDGYAFSPMMFANNISGTYFVTAQAAGAVPATFTLTNAAGAPATMSIVQGSGQTAPVQKPFAVAPEVLVTDSFGNPVSGTTVTWSAPANDPTYGDSPTITSTTDAQGIATGSFRAGTMAGSYFLTATDGSLVANFSFTNGPENPDQLIVVKGSSQTGQVGASFATELEVRALDGWNNPVPNVEVQWTCPTTSASCESQSGATTTDAAGDAFDQIYANTVAGTYSVEATLGSLSAQFSLRNASGPPSVLQLDNGSGQSTRVSTSFSNQLVLGALDEFGNPIQLQPVVWSAPTVGASIVNPSTQPTTYTSTFGTALSPPLTANSIAGTYDVTATIDGASANFQLTNEPLAVNHLVIDSGSGQSVVRGYTFAHRLVVTAVDALGNGVPGVSVVFVAPTNPAFATATFPASTQHVVPRIVRGPGANSATVTTGPTGVATSPPLAANQMVGSYYVNAVVPGLSTSQGFALSNIVGADLSVSATASPGTGREHATISLTVFNHGPDIASHVRVTLKFASRGIKGVVGTGCSRVLPTPSGLNYEVSCVIKSLNVSATRSFTLVATGPRGAGLKVTVAASSYEVDPDHSNNSVTVSTAYL
jgi:hypothetical protein